MRRFACSLTLSFLGIALVAGDHGAAPAKQKSFRHGYDVSETPEHGVTVADAIRMTKLGDASYFAGGSSEGKVGLFSPDGKKVAVVLRRGNLENNTNDYSLLLWKTADLFSSPAPQVLLTMSSSSNREGIADLRWLPDSETVTFLGENPGEEHQLYALHADTRSLEKLTSRSTSVTSYSLTPSGNAMAFIAQAPPQSLWNDTSYREGIVVSRQSIPDLILGIKRDPWIEEGELYYKDSGGLRRMNVIGTLDSSPGQSRCFLSPDGKYIVVSAKVPNAKIPQAWKHYRNASLEFNKRADTQRILPLTSYLQRYELIDTATGASRILLDAPIWPPNAGVVWLPDSRSVILSEVFLPYAKLDPSERGAREQHAFVVEVSVPDGELTKIADNRFEAVRWDLKTNRLYCENLTGQTMNASPIAFIKDGRQWHKSNESIAESTQPELVLKEGMNDPPKIFVTRHATREETLLLDLNRQFRALRFGKVQEIRWQWSNGHTTSAGLYYPRGYIPGKHYPLVIQTHGWSSSRFWIDGPETTAYAAQPLGSRGIMVLQVDDEHLPWHYGRTGQRREIEEALSIYETGVEYLDRKGLIDRERIGIMGYSHTCFYVKYALVHSRIKFAAASTTEGEDGGYLQFMTNGNLFVDAYSLYGGRPFGKALNSWIAIAPGFNTDKTNAPLRITTLNPHNILLDWEWFEALTLLRKPVDMVMMKDGDHVLEKPWERVISQEGNVDWFDFWLNGHEENDISKVSQYRRWRQLRALQHRSERN